MSAMASQITGISIFCSIVCSGADQKKTQKLRVTGLCEGNPPVTGGFPHKGQVKWKMFPFDDVIMKMDQVMAYRMFSAKPLPEPVLAALSNKLQWNMIRNKIRLFTPKLKYPHAHFAYKCWLVMSRINSQQRLLITYIQLYLLFLQTNVFKLCFHSPFRLSDFAHEQLQSSYFSAQSSLVQYCM